MKKIYAIGGGKGGSGKSFITASLGILLAKQGKRVVLVDLDLGASNLHTLLGVKTPQTDLDGFINKKTNKLEDVALSTTIPDLYLISSTQCSLEIANLFYAQKMKLVKAIRNLPFDYVLIDLGPGTHFNTIDFFLITPEGLFVTTPEPTAIENTFLFVKSVYLRKIKQVLKQANMTHILQDEIANLSKQQIKSPIALIESLMRKHKREGKILENSLTGLKFKFIVNKFSSQVNENLGQQIANVCNRHLYPNFTSLGNVSYDTRVFEAVINNRIFIQKYPYTKAVLDLQNLVKRLVEDQSESTAVEFSK
jgi:flagellar biosynthesis protein FlhG